MFKHPISGEEEINACLDCLSEEGTELINYLRQTARRLTPANNGLVGFFHSFKLFCCTPNCVVELLKCCIIFVGQVLLLS